MAHAPLLQRFVDDELARSSELVRRTLESVQEQLRQQRDGGPLSPSERPHQFDLIQALAQHQAAFRQRFTEHLRQAALTELDREAAGIWPGTEASGPGRLQLMDESLVEADIEVSRAIQLIDTVAEWELRELQTLTSTLRGQDHVTAESNPLRPQAYAQALWAAAHALPVARVQQVLLLRLTAAAMAGLLKSAWSQACERLESQGVTPSIYRTVVLGPGVGARPAPQFDVTQPGALDAVRRAMPHGGASPVPARPATPAVDLPLPTASELEQALGRIEALLGRLPAGQDGPAAPPRLADHREALIATTGDMVERQIIELLSRLFEVILNDPSLHSPMRRVLARLQVPALRIALKDPSTLDDYAHPLWMLMARLISTSACYPFPADPRLLDLLGFSDTLTSYLCGQPRQDAALMRNGLARLEAFLNEQLRQQQLQAQPGIDALARAEQADRLQQEWAARLSTLMAPMAVGPVIRRFLIGPWAALLTQATLNFGEKDEQTLGHLKVAEEMIWSLQLPADRGQSRQRLVQLLPGLLQRLRVGMALAEMPEADQQAVLDELMARHAQALRPGTRPAPQEATQSPEEIMRRLREEIEPPPGAGATFGDSLIDLASMETVPAELMPAAPLPGLAPALVVGQRYRIFLHGRWNQVQLLWRSEQGSCLLFAGETAARTHSITQRALERLREAGLVKVVDAHSLIQRAVDAMLKKL